MRSATSLLALSAPLFASAAPLFSRQGPTDADKLVFKFAHVLEQLETQFYAQAIAKYKAEDFLAAGYSSPEVAAEQLVQIQADEAAHTTALESAIKAFGDQPITNCQFNFDSALTDVATTMTVARVVEMVGVGAYLGAANLLSDPRFLTSAASILTIEARHQTVLNALNGGATIPQPFDIPLGPDQVVSIASGFISGCDLGVKGTPALAVTNTGPIGPGTQLTFKSDAVDAAQGQQLFCNMIVGGATTAISLPIAQCVVPAGINGPVAVIVTSDDQPLLASDLIDQAKKQVVAGPALLFVDFNEKEQTLSQLILTPGSKLTKNLNGVAQAPQGTRESVSTISPQQASASINGATATDGAAAAGTTPAPAGNGQAALPAPAGLPATDIFLGDIIPKLPASGAAEAPAPTAVGAPAASAPAAGPIPAQTISSVPADATALPAPTEVSGAGAAAPAAATPVPVATDGPEVTEAGGVSVAAAPVEAGAVVV